MRTSPSGTNTAEHTGQVTSSSTENSRLISRCKGFHVAATGGTDKACRDRAMTSSTPSTLGTTPTLGALESAASLDAFHPAVQRWFSDRLGEPTAPQREGWPAIRAGKHTLIAAPTGSGKTLAAFLSAIDQLFSAGDELGERTQVLYISPLKALASDIQKNLEVPLAEIRALDPSLPELRVSVRTGDTSAKHRAS